MRSVLSILALCFLGLTAAQFPPGDYYPAAGWLYVIYFISLSFDWF